LHPLRGLESRGHVNDTPVVFVLHKILSCASSAG
jgi:hypothetical protein